MSRKFPRKIRRVVIKLGSSLIATPSLQPDMTRLSSIVDQIVKLQKQNISVVLVSSGAIVLGLGDLDKNSRIVGLPLLQAAAALGQTKLMRVYHDLFLKKKTQCAQILLTWDDFDDRSKYTNARRTLNALFDNNAVPIINENDTISTDEIRRGDNDKLSALVASLVQADLLILLSDVDGLYRETKGEKKVISEVKKITEDIKNLAKGTGKKLFAKGGMRSKLDAVHVASHAKIPVIIANGRSENVIVRAIDGERIGTFFVEKNDKMLDRKHWISFGAKPKGYLVVDKGAQAALLKGGRSLLWPGLVSYEGSFKKGDVVTISDGSGKEIARGITGYSSHDVKIFLEDKTSERGVKAVIHVDDLVLGEW